MLKQHNSTRNEANSTAAASVLASSDDRQGAAQMFFRVCLKSDSHLL